MHDQHKECRKKNASKAMNALVPMAPGYRFSLFSFLLRSPVWCDMHSINQMEQSCIWNWSYTKNCTACEWWVASLLVHLYTLKLSDVYNEYYRTGSMAWRLLDAEPLHEPTMTYCQWPWWQLQCKCNRISGAFFLRNAFEMSSTKLWPFCFGLSVLIIVPEWQHPNHPSFK